MSKKRHNTYISNIYTSSDDDEDILLETRNNKSLERKNNKSLFGKKNHEHDILDPLDSLDSLDSLDQTDQLDYKHL